MDAPGPLSPALNIALRSWVAGSAPHRQLVEDWLSWPSNYQNQRKTLYYRLVADLESRIPDPRPERRFYMDGVFSFSQNGHQGAWDGLASLDTIARAVGKRGLVLLFDEFEDVIQNLNNRNYQVSAFNNLFAFFGGRFPGVAYFAVTPEFAERCKDELYWRGVADFPVERFDDLPAFELDPIRLSEFEVLSERIVRVWESAYGVPVDGVLHSDLVAAWGGAEPDQVRNAIQRLIAHLDRSRRR